MKLILASYIICIIVFSGKSQQFNYPQHNRRPSSSHGQRYPNNDNTIYFAGNTDTTTQSVRFDYEKYLANLDQYRKFIAQHNISTLDNNKKSEPTTTNDGNTNVADRLQVIRPGDSEESPIASNPVRFFGVPVTEVEQLNNVTYALTTFGVNLMKSVNNLQTGNIIVSPTSIATVLALLQQGVTGDAQNEITRSLQMTPEVIAPTYQRLTYDMKKRNSRNILTVSNHLYLGDGFEINATFKETAVKNFGSEVTTVDFSKPVLAVRQINKWVSIQTHNRIENLLPYNAVNPNTQLVIANAVYFKGLWETKFKKEATKPLIFRLGSGESKAVDFMRMRHAFKYGIDEDTQARVVTMPFERHQYSLILILPHQLSNVDTVLNSLTHKKLVNYLNLEEIEVQLEIPKFTIKSDTNMIPVLKGEYTKSLFNQLMRRRHLGPISPPSIMLLDVGVKSIFSSQTDLSGIGTYRTFSPEISQAIHTGYLSVDEQGLSAAAASGFAAIALSFEEPAAIFQANRPFLAVLWDTQFAIPLFIARIEDPSL